MLPDGGGVDVRVVREHAHLERERAARDPAPDLPEADEAEGVSRQLVAEPARAFVVVHVQLATARARGASASGTCRASMTIARDRELRDGVGVLAGRRDDRDAARRRRVEVHVDRAAASHADEPQAGRRVKHRVADRRSLDDQHVVAVEGGDDLRRAAEVLAKAALRRRRRLPRRVIDDVSERHVMTRQILERRTQ